MRDRGGIRHSLAFEVSRHAVVASALISVLACGETARAQSFEQFFTNPRLAEKKPSTRTITDKTDPPSVLEMSQDQALWMALALEDVDQLRQILKQGGNPNTVEELSLMTPLMAAETLQIAWVLLGAGGNPNARDRMGRTPMHYAPRMRDAALVVPLLARAGGDVNARSGEPAAVTPLFCAVESYLESAEKPKAGEVVRILVQYGADINASDNNGATVLAIAAAHNQPELIKLLVGLGADPTKRLVNGRTPMDYAREANATDAIQLLNGATTGTVTGN